MSSQGWLYFWEVFSIVGTSLVIVGLFMEYGLDVWRFLRVWRKREIPEFRVKIESPSERKGGALVVFGIVIELLGAAGTVVQSFRVETQHQREFARLGLHTTALTLMAGDRTLLDTPVLSSLVQFPNMPTVVTPDCSFDREMFNLSSALDRALARAHWKIVPAGQADPGLKYDKLLSAGAGVRITTRILPVGSPYSRGHIPTRLGPIPPPATPDEKAAAAAQALVAYLRSIGISAERGDAVSRALPNGEVHIAVGHRPSSIDPELLANLENTLNEMSEQ